MAKTKAQLEQEVAELTIRLQKAERLYVEHRLFAREMKAIANGLYAFSGGKENKDHKKTAAEKYIYGKAVKIYDGIKGLDSAIERVKKA